MTTSKIYIIDDNQAVCESLRFLFDSILGMEVEIYKTSKTFLDKFSADWRGCLIIDFFMPVVNGTDLMKELKIRKNKMGVIMISGNCTPDIAEQSLKSGADSFITKPFKIDNLLENVKKVLEKSYH